MFWRESASNSSVTPLSGGATFTGSGELNSESDVMVSCKSDTAGTLFFDFSVDNENWETFPTSGFVVKANIHEFHTAIKGPRYFRTRFVNGASAQSEFRLKTYYGVFRQPSAPLNQPIGLDADAINVRSSFPWLDVSRGLTSGMQVIEKFGYNSSIGTGFTPVCSGGTYQTPTSAVSLEFVSSSASDALNSTGMHEITVEGLDANWESQTVTVAAHATNGTTAVALTGTWLRVFRAWVSKSGAYANPTTGSHVGTITIRVASGGATYAQIPIINSFPVGQSLIGAYTVPAGFTAYIFLKQLSIDSGKTVDAAFFVRQSADDVTSTYDGTMRIKSLLTGITGGAISSTGENRVPLGPYVGPTDIGFMASGATTPKVSVEFEIFLVAE